MADGLFNCCPRCGSKEVGWKYVRFANSRGKKVYCRDCELTLVNRSIDYLYWRWNRPKEEQADFLVPLVDKGPDNLAFCSNDLIDVWGGSDNLCDYVSKESKRKVVCVPAVYNSNGVLLKGL